MTKTALTWVAELRTDLFSCGRDECGEELAGEAGYVTVEAPDGRRFAHDRVFKFTVTSYDEDGFLHVGTDSKQVAAAERFLSKVQAAIAAGTWAGPEGNDHWGEIEPCYGSAAYQANQAHWEFNAMDDEEKTAYLYRHGGACPA